VHVRCRATGRHRRSPTGRQLPLLPLPTLERPLLGCDGSHHDALTITEDGSLTWFSPADGVEYGFCSRCGSSLMWRVADRPELISVSAGCLDQPTGLTTVAQIWMAEHGDYHPHLPAITKHEYD